MFTQKLSTLKDMKEASLRRIIVKNVVLDRKYVRTI